MERRKVLAAISAAIATPADAWMDQWQAERIAAGEDPHSYKAGNLRPRPDMGLTPEQNEVRLALRDRVQSAIDALFDTPGTPPLVDLWLLTESLNEYDGSYRHEFGGLFSAINFILGRDERVLVVQCDDREAVSDFAESLKGSDDMVLRCPRRLGECIAAIVAAMRRHEEKDLHLWLADDSKEPGTGDLETIKAWNIPARGTPAPVEA